ncbi:flagellar FliJ protein [Steroidobacter denitrificans]|uniref:Flagellar FliJ protein n=1 Tax=Steroidobacter denitrificans TaxID=465721 RepID=A0A127F849_STEDE|nr:flagellar export protein FliJ [Steroidobacter denitrificans]AMN46602.1 flagellar FliJ protein [Steroidobacter denitrificans]
MTRAKRLQPVRNLVDDAQQRLAQSLSACEQRLRESESRLEELRRYRSEYETHFSRCAGSGMGVTGLRDYQAFLARLGQAIGQQQELVGRAAAQRDAERTRWQEAARRAKALGHVLERWQSEERQALDRREQRDSDERAQRKVNRS